MSEADIKYQAEGLKCKLDVLGYAHRMLPLPMLLSVKAFKLAGNIGVKSTKDASWLD